MAKAVREVPTEQKQREEPAPAEAKEVVKDPALERMTNELLAEIGDMLEENAEALLAMHGQPVWVAALTPLLVDG
jgi:hypothetical protein